MSTRIASVLIIGLALGLAVGCSKSSTTQASFESSSDSSSSPFKSSSKSSGSGDEAKDGTAGDRETAFQRDVRNHTAAFARSVSEPDLDSFQRDLGVIAEDHGITNWEQFADTYIAIGRGLAAAEIDDWSAQQLAVALSEEDIEHLKLVRSGYENRKIR